MWRRNLVFGAFGMFLLLGGWYTLYKTTTGQPFTIKQDLKIAGDWVTGLGQRVVAFFTTRPEVPRTGTYDNRG